MTEPALDRLLPAGLLGVLGGPGRRLRPSRHPGYAVAVLVLLVAAPVGFAVLRQGYCLQHGWDGSAPLWRQCYSDLAASMETGGVGGGLAAYLSSTGGVHVDQPVLSGAAMSLLGGIAPGDGLGQQRWFVALWAVLAVLLLGAVVWFVTTTRGVRADPAQVALAPVVALTILLSPDVLGVALASAALWAWSRRRPVSAGILLAAAVMARTYPAILIVAIAAIAVRMGQREALIRFGRAFVLTVLGIVATFLVTDPAALTRPYSTWWHAGAGLGSPWYLFSLAGSPIGALAASVIAVIGWVVAAALVVVLALGAPHRPSLGALALVGVGVILLTGKSFPVQASLWLVPLVAIAGTRWRDHLWWAGAEAMHFVAVWLYVGGLQAPDRALPGGWYALFLALRLVAVGYLVWRAWDTTAGRPPSHAPTHLTPTR